MMRVTPLNSLPKNYTQCSTLGRYTFYKNENNKIIWKRDDSPYYVINSDMTSIPTEERFMFWYDKSFRNELVLNYT